MNKLWNIGKYTHFATSNVDVNLLHQPLNFSSLPTTEKYIVSKLHVTAIEVTRCMAQYAFAEMARLIYDFLWNELADWYIEASKTRQADHEAHLVSRQCLVYCLEISCRLLHPIMPHVTEVLWQNLPHLGESIMISDWPVSEKVCDYNMMWHQYI